MTMIAAPEITKSSRLRLRDLTASRFARSIAVSTQFFESQADNVAEACRAMALRFQQAGRLIVFGSGAAATDAQHVSVEFVHPVLMGKRALPALALTSDVASLSANSADLSFVRPLSALGRPGDIAMGITTRRQDVAVARALAYARGAGLLAVELTAASPPASEADFAFVVPSDDPFVVQEVQETLYHVLWELVHVFLDARTSRRQPHA